MKINISDIQNENSSLSSTSPSISEDCETSVDDVHKQLSTFFKSIDYF